MVEDVYKSENVFIFALVGQLTRSDNAHLENTRSDTRRSAHKKRYKLFHLLSNVFTGINNKYQFVMGVIFTKATALLPKY